jgi:AraC-like DNA-binding protein
MLRVAAAKDMLESTALSVQTVCSKIGYEDLAHFRSLFKRHTGMTPAEYRGRFARKSVARSQLARPTTEHGAFTRDLQGRARALPQ